MKIYLLFFLISQKKYGEIINNIILFECNNKKCKGTGEYDIEKKIFKVTEEHNLSWCFHNIAVQHYNAKESLLNDKHCFGYQLLKDFSFVKDENVVIIK